MADIALTRAAGAAHGALQWPGLTVTEQHAGPLALIVGARAADFPTRLGTWAEAFGRPVLALAPDRWLAFGGDAGAAAWPPDLSVHDVTDGYGSIRIGGDLAEALLAAATGVDLSPAAFPAGEARLTEFARIRALLLRREVRLFDVLFDVSAADYAWDWTATHGALVASTD